MRAHRPFLSCDVHSVQVGNRSGGCASNKTDSHVTISLVRAHWISGLTNPYPVTPARAETLPSMSAPSTLNIIARTPGERWLTKCPIARRSAVFSGLRPCR